MGRARQATMAVIAVGIIILALDSLVWWWLSNRVIAQFGEWQAAERDLGLVVSAGPPSRAGWPLQAAAVLPDVTVATRGGATWHTGELRLIFQPWRPGVFTAILTGPQQVRLGPGLVVEATARRIEAAIPLDPARSAVTVVEAHGLAASMGARTAAAERVSLRFDQTDLDFAGDLLMLPKPAPGRPPLPFDGIINSLRLHARSTVAVPLAADWPASLAAWQRMGGQLELTGVALLWGPLNARGSATLHLTPALQPEGSGSVQLTGFAAAISALQRSGTITRDAAEVAGAVFGLLAKNQSGQAPEVDLPLTLQYGLISAGAIPLLRVPNFIAN